MKGASLIRGMSPHRDRILRRLYHGPPPPHHPHPDVAQASGPVPNCSTTNRPTSILKHGQALPNTQETSGGGLGFNSSCQQCIAERAIVSGVNTVSK